MEELQKIYAEKKSAIQSRLEQFRGLDEKDYIKEFVFCLLTPQSNAQRCWEAVEEIFSLDKNEINEEKIREILSRKTRFHNTKAKRVLEAEKNWKKIKSELGSKDILSLRNWLAENVNGYGLKESSHFLRNVGLSGNEVAILDRHILRNLKEAGAIPEEKIKSKKNYLEIEKAFKEFSGKVGIPIDELDLLWWSKENGEIFK
jgi:N-glycosylase/DNA lyase